MSRTGKLMCVLVASGVTMPLLADIEEVLVTATKRDAKLSESAISASVISNDIIERYGLNDLANIADVSPGMNFVDLGARDIGNNIIMRGVNTAAIGPFMSGTYKTPVATYLGETPMYVDLKPIDIARIEVLQGPQGTLYGASTLAGAVRYIPEQPQYETAGALWSEISQYSEASSQSYVMGGMLNVPLADNLAVRLAVQQLEDSGYIDYNMIVRDVGVSNPQPDFNDPSAVQDNLRAIKDNNGEETLTVRAAIRYEPLEWAAFDVNYWFQDQQAEGQSLSHTDSLHPLAELGPFESGMRVEEPSDIRNELLSVDTEFDLGFATFHSSSAITQFNENGVRDQTDFFLRLGFGYEEFEGFTAFANDRSEDTAHIHEFRLVSKHEGVLSWITGYYFNDYRSVSSSREYTPLYDDWLTGVDLRADDLDFIGVGDEQLTERAFYGELTADLGPLSITLGGRYYDYDNSLSLAFDLPLTETVFFDRPDGSIVLDPVVVSNNDDGNLFKLNVAYEVNEDTLFYVTASEGYRLGGINGLTPCTESTPEEALPFCALEDEVAYEADTTLNKEIGLRTRSADGRLALHVVAYHIDWDDIQVPTVTENGDLNILVGGGEAVSRGLEVSMQWQATEALLLSGQYTYNDAYLNEDAPGLVRGDDGLKGDTLPGSPDHSASFGAQFQREILGLPASIDYLMRYVGDIYTTVGARGNGGQGEVLNGYTLSDVSVSLNNKRWRASLFIDNVFDKNVVTAVRRDRSDLVSVGGVKWRGYGRYYGQPRNIGVRLRYTF